MKQIGKSSLWVEKYRPKSVDDLILPNNYRSLFENIVKKKDLPNLLLAGSAGLGKTTSALVLANELGADSLLINASLETSIDVLRSKVTQFAMTSSFSDGKKIVILDEFDRVSSNAMDSTKGIIEQTEANCRFILTTNNLGKIIDPIKSRTQLIDFAFTKTDIQDIIMQYFKRCCMILDNEKIPFDKKVLAEFVKQYYPDFRKIINELQKASTMFETIDIRVMSLSSESLVGSLIDAMKSKKLINMQKIISNIDPDNFYTTFYNQIFNLLDNRCVPDVILALGEGSYRNAIVKDKEIQLLATAMQISKNAIWK